MCACTFRTFGNHDYILPNLVFSNKNNLLDLDSRVKFQDWIIVGGRLREVIIKGTSAQKLPLSQPAMESNQMTQGNISYYALSHGGECVIYR